MAMELVETIEVGSGGAASIGFTSIPQDGVDLLLLLSIRSDRSADQDNIDITLNSSSSNFSVVRLYGTGSSASSASTSSNLIAYAANAATSTSNTFSNTSIYISNYAASLANSISIETTQEDNATGAYSSIQAMQWNDTSAINAVGLAPNLGTNWLQYSVVSLYKIS